MRKSGTGRGVPISAERWIDDIISTIASTGMRGRGQRNIATHFSRNKVMGANLLNHTLPIHDVHTHRFQNGLKVLTREDHAVLIVSSVIWYGVGSRLEEEGITGISHFLEHMMFKGTSRYGKGEIDYITARRGGSNNAFTSYDYTAYYFTFASDRWWPALEIEADRMRNNLFDPEEFELERQVVLEELKMDLDSPWGALRKEVETLSFVNHPYRFPVIGNCEDVRSLTRRQMVDYYSRFYCPDNATLVLVGDFQSQEVVEGIEQLFGHIPRGGVSISDPPRDSRRQRQTRVELKRPSHIDRLCLAFPSPSVREEAHYALHVLDRVLSEGKLSRLYRRLVEEERLASYAATEYLETYDPFLFFVRVGLHPGADVSKAEALVFDQVAALRETLISAEELERAKNQCVTETLSGFESTLDQAIQLGLMETLTGYRYWVDYARRINQLTAEDIRSVARDFLTPEQATVGILSNEQGDTADSSL